MKIASMVLGIIGAVFGVVAGIIAMFVGSIGHALHASGANTVGALGWGALLASVVGLVGAIMVGGKPKVAAVLMLVAGVAGIICVSYFYILPGILLIIPGVMSFFVKKRAGASSVNSASM